MINNLLSEIPKSQDCKLLSGILRTLIGTPCLKIELGYADELTAHFGSPKTYRHPNLAEESRGSSILGSRASYWEFSVGNPPLLVSLDQLESDSSIEVERHAQQFNGATVIDAVTENMPVAGHSELGRSLLIRFSNGATLSLVPTDDPDNTDLPDWELFTPLGMHLMCGPGQSWSYLSSETNTHPSPAVPLTA